MHPQFTLKELQYFVAVSHSGTISGAAEMLGVSPPSVSIAVSQLEAKLGVELFHRRHRCGVTPTSTGITFLSKAQAILDLAHELREAASAQAR